jgi:predicted dienelactone hydrolase
MPGKWIPRDANMEAPVPIISARSIHLSAPARGEDVQVRISAPVEGENLPVILFSHGFGSSMDGYAPLTDYWAARGFLVVQPNYLDARRLGLATDDPRRPHIWRTRVEDAKRVLDDLRSIANVLPGLADRLDTSLVAAAGHSFGGQTTSMLLGARMVGAGGDGEDMSDPRVKAGVLLASGGKGGDDLSDMGRQMTPYLDSGFEHMNVPTLVVAGDHDRSPLTTRGPDWFYDPFKLAPGDKALLTLFGGEHMLGGISGYEVTETTDEDADRVALIQKATQTFLRAKLLGCEDEWTDFSAAMVDDYAAVGCLQLK